MIASVVDIGSILVAYRIGVSEIGLAAGLAYGLFDAWIVIWQRERIITSLNYIYRGIRRSTGYRRRDSLPWIPE